LFVFIYKKDKERKMNFILSTLTLFSVHALIYSIVIGLHYFILMIVLKKWTHSRVIQKNKTSILDIKREIYNSFFALFVFSVCISLLGFFNINKTMIYNSVNADNFIYTLFSFPLLLILHDTYVYWSHRLLHTPFLFKWVHKTHHLSKTPTVLTSFSFSPIEALILNLFLIVIVFFVPLHNHVITLLFFTLLIRNTQGHSGVEFHPKSWIHKWTDIFTTVTFHDMHHENIKGNFGVYFTWWDRLMGTELSDYKKQFLKNINKNK
jgi:sterol desaturase/sphingolipid hydroxylase (fatty acid hydroxylase superfamily)